MDKRGLSMSLSRFSNTYAEAKERFLAAARKRNIPIKSYPHPLTGPSGEALSTDVALIGPAHASRILILESSLHGVEGYPGSALQLGALEEIDLPTDGDVALLLVHARSEEHTSALQSREKLVCR